MTKIKLEGRTQLASYAVQNRLVETITEARKTDLDHLRRVVTLHRQMISNQTKPIETTTATTAEKE